MSEATEYNFTKHHFDGQSSVERHRLPGFAGSPYIYRDRDGREDEDGYDIDPHAELLRQLLTEVRGLREGKQKSEGGTKELAAAYAAIAVFLASIGISLLSYVQDTFSARSNEESGLTSHPTDSAINCLLYLSVIFAVLAAVVFVVSQTMQEAGYHRHHHNQEHGMDIDYGRELVSRSKRAQIKQEEGDQQQHRQCRRKLHKQQERIIADNTSSSSSTAESVKQLQDYNHLVHHRHQTSDRDVLPRRASRAGTLSGMTIVNPSPRISRRPTLEPILTGSSVAVFGSSGGDVVSSPQALPLPGSSSNLNGICADAECCWEEDGNSQRSDRTAATTRTRADRPRLRTRTLTGTLARDGTREYDIASITLVSSLSTLFAGLLVYLWAERPHSVAIPCSVMILLSPGVVYVVLRDRVLALVNVVKGGEV